jgi:hypothetical protein
MYIRCKTRIEESNEIKNRVLKKRIKDSFYAFVEGKDSMDYEKAWRKIREENRRALDESINKPPYIRFDPIDQNELIRSVLQTNERIFDELEEEFKIT